MKFSKIPRQVVLLGLISFFTDIASEMLYPVVPIFLTASLGASMAMVGVIEGIAEVTAGFLKGYFGVLSDKLRKRSLFIQLGYGLSAIVKPLPGFFPYISTVVVSRVVDRIGKGIRTAPRDALLASNANGNSGAVFGFHRGMDTLGAMTGPLVALLLLYLYPGNYSLIFFAVIPPSIFAIICTWFVKDPAGIKTKNKFAGYKNFWKTAPAQFKVLLAFVTMFSLVNSSDVFLILKSRNISNSDSTAIFGYVFYNFIYAFSSYPIGIISDKYGKKKIFITGLFIFSIVYFGFAFNQSMPVVWILFALYGIYAASTEGVTKAWVSDLIPDEYRGSAIGLLTTLSSLAVMISSVLTGILWDNFGAQIPFLISSVVTLLVAIGLILFNWK
ncbi:MAG: MFS transporter [bacterium]